jgi:predicted Rossmann fold flavoprotein
MMLASDKRQHNHTFKGLLKLTAHKQHSNLSYDLIIIGAGAAGLMCAISAATQDKKILVIEHGKKIGPKILISGGGRCNFTNLEASWENYLSRNEHFAKSALSRYTPYDFIDLMAKHTIGWHEKKLGQLFCDDGAKRVVTMLSDECDAASIEIKCETTVQSINANVLGGYQLQTSMGALSTRNLVIATGGKSIPAMGATGFAYDAAKQFGLEVTDTRPGLVPFTFGDDMLAFTASLSGVSLDCKVCCGNTCFRENILFTHRGLSGPAILQISSFWHEGESISIDILPDIDALEMLKSARKSQSRSSIKMVLAQHLPARLAQALVDKYFQDGKMAALSNNQLESIADHLNHWQIKPTSTEGYRTAEVTLGGVHTDGLSSKTMQAKAHQGLYFIGECVDVTGWLGGYNFQWAWASGHAAGQAIQLSWTS